MDAKQSGVQVIRLDREWLQEMRGTSSLRQQVSSVFELLREPVYHYLLTLLNNTSEAEDLTQETFLRLYLCLRRGETIVNARAWLFRVAHNLAINQATRIKQSKLESVDDQIWQQLCDLRQDPAPGAEERLLEWERHERLQTNLARMTEQERLSLELRAEGLGYREVADILGLPTQTLVSLVGRAIKKLMRELND